ncbi:MAG: DUF350 domain-containing protein [Spirochaetota bacterium]|nr:DUF350 domain-containing protein [Spirochaetota bacterium]
MLFDQIITALIYLVAVLAILFLGKWVYDKLNPRFNLKVELVKNDNFALALAVVGYFLGLVLSIGGILDGPSSGWAEDVIDIFFYGIISIVLLNISIIINDKIILYQFDNIKEIIQDKNAGTGIVEAANHIAMGLVMYGAVSGEGGDLITLTVFWIAGQIVLILAGLIYNWIIPYDMHEQIEKDNAAVGVAFAGLIIAIGNIIRIGLSGDFISWQENFYTFGSFVIFGLILLPIIRFVADKILLPGEHLTDELINQENPNIGAAAIEAFSYIGASFLIGWVL